MRRILVMVVFAACSSSTTDNPDGGNMPDGTVPDTYVPPMAMGDPCRGTPLPTDQHWVPAGMCARVVGSVGGGLRQITFAPNGDLFATATNGQIRLLKDANGNGTYDMGESTAYASTGGNGNNAHVDAAGGFLYAGSNNGVKRFPYSPTMMTGGAGEDVVVGQPNGGHTYHTVHVYDGFLYVHSGSAGNMTNDSNPNTSTYDTSRSLIRRFDLSKFTPGSPFQWASGEIFSQGLRNMVGFTQNGSKRMYGVVNGLDDISYGGQNVHNDNPGEQLVQLGMGKKFGYPYCFTAQRVIANNAVVMPGTQLVNVGYPVTGVDDMWCATNSSPPATFFQAHSAPLDITFFDTQPVGALPEKYRGGAFVTFHGSWDRSPATGYKVVWVPFDAQGNAPMPTSTMTDTTFPYEVVLGGGNASAPKDGPWNWSANGMGDGFRPVGVAIHPIDGALYVSTDSGGLIYRVGIKK